MSGHVGDLSGHQMAKLDEFRNAVKDVLSPHHDDYYLLRWLRAREFNASTAETMLRKDLKWRAQVGADTILDDFQVPEVLTKYFAQGLIGHDKEGGPVWIVHIGNIDIKGLLYSAKKSDIVKYVCYILEKSEMDMQEESEKQGRIIETHTVIVDMENFCMKQLAWKPSIDLITTIASLYEEHYPERLRKAIVVNASKLFPLVFAIVKPFLSERTTKKIYIYAKGAWKGPVLEEIDANELPEHWGGNLTGEDGNPFCSPQVCMGGPVPCSYYMAPSRRLSSDQNMKMAVVDKKGLFPLPYDIETPGSAIKWAFQTENYDIAFGVFYEPPGDDANQETKEEVIIPYSRANAHLVPEDGMLICDRPGRYILKFDNSFSWCRSKKLMYEVSILTPEESVLERSDLL